VACTAIFIYENLSNFGAFVGAFAMSPAAVFGEAQPYRIISAAFTHLSVLHVGMNMLSLVSLGSSLEPLFGSLGFFFLTLLYLMLVGLLFLGLAVCVSATLAASTPTVAMVVKVRKRPSTPTVSCWVSTKARPKVAEAAKANATPAPISAHCRAAPRPEAAPSTSSAKASPAIITGMAHSTARSGWWPYKILAHKAVVSG
jgi:hypothetical protein